MIISRTNSASASLTGSDDFDIFLTVRDVRLWAAFSASTSKISYSMEVTDEFHEMKQIYSRPTGTVFSTVKSRSSFAASLEP